MSDDTALDRLLNTSRPEVAHVDTCAECARVVGATAGSGRRWPRRVALAGAAGAAVLAIGAGAAAVVGLPGVGDDAPVEHTQVVSNGDECRMTFTISDEAGHHDAETVAAAKLILSSIDPSTLDISDDLKKLVDDHENETWEGPGPEPDYQYAFDSQDSLEAQAVTDAVWLEIRSRLRAQGHNVAFRFESEFLCDDHEKAGQ